MLERRLLLASQSPRRAKLLEQMGLTFEVQPADIDESPIIGEDAIAYVDRLAKKKAQHQWRSGFVHLGADTIVVLDGVDLRYPGQLLSLAVLKFCCWHIVSIGLAWWRDAVGMLCQLVRFSLAQSVLGWRLLSAVLIQLTYSITLVGR